MQSFPVGAVEALAFVMAVDILIAVLLARLAAEQAEKISKIASTMTIESTGFVIFMLVAKFMVITLAEATV